MKIDIRPLIEEDAYTSVKWRNDPEVFKYTGNTYDHIISIESELAWIRKVIFDTTSYRCAIIADGVYVGNIYLTDIDGISAHYHIFIGEKSYWGRGVAKAASVKILDYAFSSLRLKQVTLKVRPENLSAYYLYKHLGFQETDKNFEWISMRKCNDFL